MSSDMMNLFYAWFAPITSLVWYAQSWTPVFIFVESETVSTSLQVFEFIMKQVEEAGGEVVWVKNNLPKQHYFPGMVTTASHFAACVEDWPEDTYVLIGDSDTWPLNKKVMDYHTSFPAAVHVFDGQDMFQYAACYIGMNVSMWREIMKFKKGDDMLKVIAEMRQEDSTGVMTERRQWSIDQRISTKRIKNWHGFPHQVHFYGHRDYSSDRLDRVDGASNFIYRQGLLDSHVLRPGFTRSHWPKLRALLTHLLNSKQLKFVDKYAVHFCSMVKCSNITISESMRSSTHPRWQSVLENILAYFL